MDQIVEGPLTTFDIIVIAVIAVSALMSLGRGLAREATSVVSFIVGGLAAYYCLVFFHKPLAAAVPETWPRIAPAAILVVVGFIAAYSLAPFESRNRAARPPLRRRLRRGARCVGGGAVRPVHAAGAAR
jgi:Colicin V production protein